jgi:dipeptidyl aminopeptidase/acylaminoacyl peptidase
VFDWQTMTKSIARDFDNPARAGYFKRFVGDPKKDQTKFDEFSPLRHADQISIPILVAHGYEDVTVPIGQSKSLVSALEARKIPCETMFSVDEAHGFRHIEAEVKLYDTIEHFLAKYLAPQPAGGTSK